jgi:Domain of unknown function (DUF6894)
MRYYFHLKEGRRLDRDDEGIDLPDLSAAKREALEGAREILAEAVKAGANTVPEALVIADEAGRALEIVPFEILIPKTRRD